MAPQNIPHAISVLTLGNKVILYSIVNCMIALRLNGHDLQYLRDYAVIIVNCIVLAMQWTEYY